MIRKLMLKLLTASPPSICGICGRKHEGGKLRYCMGCGQSFDGKVYGHPGDFGIRWPDPPSPKRINIHSNDDQRIAEKIMQMLSERGVIRTP